MLLISRNLPLAPLTTFRVGGAARFFTTIRSEADLLEAVAFAADEELSIFVLSGGSNLLVPDDGFNGLVVHLAIEGPLARGVNRIDVPAGMPWDELVSQVCQDGICGMECLAGIPGFVGASPIQNIGAYGQEVSQTIEAVRAYDRERNRFITLAREDCGFAYRQSLFNTTHRNRYIITSVSFAFDPRATPHLAYADLRAYFADREQMPTPCEVAEAVRAVRRAKGMLLLPDGADGAEDTRSAGSFFKNPVVPRSALARIGAALSISESAIPRYPAADGHIKLPAAWLLEKAGFCKSYADGRAGISSRHTLALINRGGATYADIARLRDRIIETIDAKFGISLEQEPVEP